MNVHEARLKVHGAITLFLVDMAAEDDATEADLEALEEEMAELADLLLEELGLDVVSAESESEFSCKINLYTGDDE